MWNARSKRRCTVTILLVLNVTLLVMLGDPALGSEWYTVPEKDKLVEQPKPYSPYVDQHFPQRVFFGDTHHHSSYSFDSGLIGNKLGPEVSFRFARGEEIVTTTGQRAKLNRPLDFLVVSDHAEYLGIADLINTANPEFLATDVGRKWYTAMQKGGDAGWLAVLDIMQDMQKGAPQFKDANVERSVWERVIDIASEYNQPGRFTAFNGYEYSPLPDGNNLHRVVIYRDGPDRVKQLIPFSAFESQDPEQLWAFMAGYEEKTGGRILAIPHNPDEGRQRDASLAFPGRRVRGLRAVGHNQSQREPQGRLDAAVRICPKRLKGRPSTGEEARSQSFQIRDDRKFRYPHLVVHHPRGQLLRQAPSS
jgi:hypothetical protein